MCPCKYFRIVLLDFDALWHVDHVSMNFYLSGYVKCFKFMWLSNPAKMCILSMKFRYLDSCTGKYGQIRKKMGGVGFKLHQNDGYY